MPSDRAAVHEAFPHSVAVVERSYEADRNVFLWIMVLLTTVAAWIALSLFAPLWDRRRPFDWAGVVQLILLLAAAWMVWAQHGVYHHDWAPGAGGG